VVSSECTSIILIRLQTPNRYISVCSLIGGLSVSCTQGLGSCIVTTIRGENQVGLSIFKIVLDDLADLGADSVQELVYLLSIGLYTPILPISKTPTHVRILRSGFRGGHTGHRSLLSESSLGALQYCHGCAPQPFRRLIQADIVLASYTGLLCLVRDVHPGSCSFPFVRGNM
jgi:hypothetical protein